MYYESNDNMLCLRVNNYLASELILRENIFIIMYWIYIRSGRHMVMMNLYFDNNYMTSSILLFHWIHISIFMKNPLFSVCAPGIYLVSGIRYA